MFLLVSSCSRSHSVSGGGSHSLLLSLPVAHVVEWEGHLCVQGQAAEEDPCRRRECVSDNNNNKYDIIIATWY